MQIVMAIDGDQKHELESMIRDLEDENKWVHVYPWPEPSWQRPLSKVDGDQVLESFYWPFKTFFFVLDSEYRIGSNIQKNYRVSVCMHQHEKALI